ncbi:MAG TPA: hypothetical protein VE967_09715 [Gemmatimonadaceae bacterium]|nr:hypothetical protein [Gemmatimonadaceae bacterium]
MHGTRTLRLVAVLVVGIVVGTGSLAPRRSSAQDSTRRPRAIQHSDLYYKRLTIHKVGSYVMLPLLAGEYYLGNKLLNDDNPSSGTKGMHSAVAGGIGVVFGVNTITGAWNLWDARHDSNGKARRYVHAVLLIAADAGIAYTASIAGDAKRDDSGATLGPPTEGGRKHRNAALASFSIATVGTAMMWLWK